MAFLSGFCDNIWVYSSTASCFGKNWEQQIPFLCVCGGREHCSCCVPIQGHVRHLEEQLEHKTQQNPFFLTTFQCSIKLFVHITLWFIRGLLTFWIQTAVLVQQHSQNMWLWHYGLIITSIPNTTYYITVMILSCVTIPSGQVEAAEIYRIHKSESGLFISVSELLEAGVTLVGTSHHGSKEAACM